MNTIESNRVYLYALDAEYFVMGHNYVPQERATFKQLKFQALCLKGSCQGIVAVYAVNNSYDVHDAYKESRISATVENRVVFKCLLDTDGIRLV